MVGFQALRLWLKSPFLVTMKSLVQTCDWQISDGCLAQQAFIHATNKASRMPHSLVRQAKIGGEQGGCLSRDYVHGDISTVVKLKYWLLIPISRRYHIEGEIHIHPMTHPICSWHPIHFPSQCLPSGLALWVWMLGQNLIELLCLQQHAMAWTSVHEFLQKCVESRVFSVNS